MAKLEIEPRHEAFAKALERAVRDREVKLTPHARMMLRLTAEAWMDEGPALKRLPSVPQSPDEIMRELATDIVDAAMDESHVVEHRQQGREVPTHILNYALVTEGKKIMKDLLDKGF